jgi:hypothetical protein
MAGFTGIHAVNVQVGGEKLKGSLKHLLHLGDLFWHARRRALLDGCVNVRRYF